MEETVGFPSPPSLDRQLDTLRPGELPEAQMYRAKVADDLVLGKGRGRPHSRLCIYPYIPLPLTLDSKMQGPWLLLALALIFTLTDIPESCALLEAAQEEGAVTPDLPDLEKVQVRPEHRFLRKDLQRVRGDLGAALDSWITKRQHPGKREEEEEDVEAEERGDLGDVEAWRPHKRQHPGRRANQDKYSWADEEDSDWLPPSWLPDFFLDSWFSDVPQVKRQHPGRRSFPWMESDVTKRQHPGRRLIDPELQRSWEEKEGEGVFMPEKRQHPGKRALGHPCGPQGICGQTGLLQLLGDLSRGQETLTKQSPQLEAWDREPLEE